MDPTGRQNHLPKLYRKYTKLIAFPEHRVSTSLIYRSSTVYQAVMFALYGRHYRSRYRAMSDLISPNSTVLDLCCGPGYLYQRFLKPKSVKYHGIDVNPQFIHRIDRAGATGQVADLNTLDPLPTADYVIMQASLYHFLPDPASIVDRMLKAGGRQVIIAEPIRNLSTLNLPLLSRLASRHANPGSGNHQQRFTQKTLDQFFSQYASRVSLQFLIPGGREKIYVLATS
jgi:trans-aconitate methyltransferase